MNELYKMTLDQHEWCELFKIYNEFRTRVPNIIQNEIIQKDSDGNEFICDISDKLTKVNDAFRDFFRILFNEMSKIEYQCDCKTCSPLQTESVSESYEVDLAAEIEAKEKRCKMWRFCEIAKNHPDQFINDNGDSFYSQCDKCKSI
jgi:hypothetical protein